MTYMMVQTSGPPGPRPMTEIPELTKAQFARAISSRVRKRLVEGHIESGEDVAALRRFIGLTQARFALAFAPVLAKPRAGQ